MKRHVVGGVAVVNPIDDKALVEACARDLEIETVGCERRAGGDGRSAGTGGARSARDEGIKAGDRGLSKCAGGE